MIVYELAEVRLLQTSFRPAGLELQNDLQTSFPPAGLEAGVR